VRDIVGRVPPTTGASEFDVALMGWGTRGVDQITVEQLRALGQARDIVVDPGAPPSIFQMLAAYPAQIHDLRPLYADDEVRLYEITGYPP